MACPGGGRGGRGDRGDQRPQYGGHGRGPGAPGGGGGSPSGFVWPPPATTPSPVPVQYQPAPMGYRAPMAAYTPPAVVYRASAPAAPPVVYVPPPAAVPVTVRAPPPAPSPAPAPQGASSRTPAPAPAPASSAPSATVLAKEVEKKLFVSETALAPPAEAASDVDLALAHPARPVRETCGKKSELIRAKDLLVDVADCNVVHYDLKYNGSGREKTCAPSVGQWNMINKKMINGGTVDNWTCLNFSRMRPEEVQRFCMDLVHMCNATGMAFNPNPFVEVRSASPNHIENALRDVYRRAAQMLTKQGMGNQLQLLVVILPEVSGSYGKIKRVCDTDIGIVSQCCLPKHASRPNKQYLENVALKINVKVGGRNTVLERAFVRNGIPFVSEVPTIIFGADVTHPPLGEDSASSIAAVVASMDWPEITKYSGLVSAQPHRQEIIEDLFTVTKDPQKGHNVNGGMIKEMLIAFRRKTNRRPERIIFYRDGVSEGQFSHVLLHEMDAIRKACASLEEGYLPPVTFVVVQKRHHTRLFPEFHGRRDMTDKSGNILPGTVVDQKICHPIEFDFYLCSHAGIQGTSLPTHYHVLYDENHFTTDALQSLTNNLCYTYARCTHAVSVVDSYTHLAALRARCYYVEGETSDGGSTPGSSGQAVAQEGPVEVRQLPKIKDNVKEKSYASSISQWNMINKKIINGGTMGRTLCGMLPTLLHKRIWSTLISNSIPNTVTFSLDGPPWQVLINYINAILHIRLWFMSRGARIDLSPLFGTESNIYTTPPDGSFFLEITFKGDSLDVIFDGREAWFKGLINKFGPLEFQPSVGKLQYIDHQGCKILDFTGYYDDLAPNGEPGQIKIGHGALIDTFLEACVHRGQPSTLEFRHKLGTIVVHFGEAPKFHWVFLCCCISIIKERMTTLDCFDNDLGVMLRKWGKLCKDVVSLLMHWLSSRGEPALNAFVEDIAKRKVPFISTVSDVLANICFYSHNSPNSKSFQNSPQPERVKWSPKDPTDKVGTRTWLVNHWPEKKSVVFCSAMWRCHLPIQHSGAIVPINQLGRSRFTTCAHIPLNSMTIGNSRCIYTAAATVWRLLKK